MRLDVILFVQTHTNRNAPSESLILLIGIGQKSAGINIIDFAIMFKHGHLSLVIYKLPLIISQPGLFISQRALDNFLKFRRIPGFQFFMDFIIFLGNGMGSHNHFHSEFLFNKIRFYSKKQKAQDYPLE
jgi:hypothetical protein